MLMMIQPFLFFAGVGAVIGTLVWLVLSIIGFIVGLYRAIKAPPAIRIPLKSQTGLGKSIFPNPDYFFSNTSCTASA